MATARCLSQAPRPAPTSCIVGETLCRVRVFTEAQWERIDPARRPTTAEYFPGLGWVAAVVGPNS